MAADTVAEARWTIADRASGQVPLPFILCGGAGTAFSREAYPKQVHRLAGPETLFQQTYRRLSGLLFGDLFVLSNHRHRFLVAEQLEEIGAPAKNLVLEPTSRNSRPASCIAAPIASRSDPDALVLLAPLDHMIADASAFISRRSPGTAPTAK